MQESSGMFVFRKSFDPMRGKNSFTNQTESRPQTNISNSRLNTRSPQPFVKRIDDKHTGRSVEVWSDKSYYCGNFEDGFKEGYGVYYWADGTRYSGEWQHDEMHGMGLF
jgi:hypothetical protein